MLINCARVLKLEGQDTATQKRALTAVGVDRIFEEKASGVAGIVLNGGKVVSLP